MSQAIEAVGGRIRDLPRPAARRSGWEWVESFAAAGLGLLILAGVLFYVWQHTQVLRESYAIERLRVQQARLVQENKALRLEIGHLRSLRRVEEIARTRLGMVSPTPGQVLLIPDSRIQ